MAELHDLTAADLLRAFSAGDASPVDALESCLDRIREVEPNVNACVDLLADQARTDAREAQDRYRNGTARALEGVPYGLKDIIATAGVTTTGGSPFFEHYVPDRDATVARRLREAGGVLVAKLQTSELATGGAEFGEVRNPWDLARISAGSSSGSAIALAARELPLTLGTDTGGSIRIPSAFCGITGLKPTYGRVSRYGVFPLSWTLDHVGPMARSAEDVALALSVIAGADPSDPTSSRLPVPDYRATLADGVAGVRIGVPENWFSDLLDAEVREATRAAIATLEAAGAVATPVRFPTLDRLDPVALGRLIIHAELASFHEVNMHLLGDYGEGFREQLLIGSLVSATDYLRALRLRSGLQDEFAAVMRDVDVLITPGAVGTAPLRSDLLMEIEGQPHLWMEIIMRTSTPFNVVGFPAVCVPSGLSRDGLPVSIQVVAAPFDEATCLRVANAFQELTPHHHARPTIPSAGVRS